ncbi:LOW QUALITY PROTEIN: inositol 1,4,5-trisphosphate receptor-interacting protein-like 2 [Hirundo rustica]|uniref:LOW QUALITY PROTEIN: inositol 1,4,5-trisphosphate receptor-interacting protein-like 2 n=1 Tax=Hirundo rustica TaxID=43150 RepID=UPI002673715F|nr:LOW QUALITY PROTEIN: inositol 1,4,5-trisphosphate receptor-interacting protein-like 2 [Hirundo rustica]
MTADSCWYGSNPYTHPAALALMALLLLWAARAGLRRTLPGPRTTVTACLGGKERKRENGKAGNRDLAGGAAPRPGPAPGRGGARGSGGPALGAAGAAEEGAGGGGRSPPAGLGGGSPRGPSPRRALPASPLRVRGLWPLLTALCTAFLCLYQALRGSAAGEGAGGPGDAEAEAAGSGRFHARQLRVSPHVLGHSKAHVGRVVAELVRAAKAQGLQPGPLALSLRGDFVRIGSAYEQHKVRSPDCFDILVPLRLPPHLEPQPRRADGPGPCGAFVCGLRARDGWTRRCRPFAEGFCVELQGRCHLSSGLVLRWFQGHLQRCLGAVRYRLQERCRVSLSACPGQPPTLHIVPCSDYVCCHISMAVRLIPAIPLGDALYLTALPPEGPHGSLAPEALWGLNASRQEQRLLGWLKEQAPAASCHLKCLQILKGLRDLRKHGLEEPFCSQWGRVLSSYLLKTALFSLLLQGPLEAWDERFLVERLEDLVLFLRDCLRKQVLMDFFLGNTSIPEAVALPRFLKEAAPVNLLSAFDGPTLDLVAFQLISTWIQAPHIIRMYSSPRYLARCPPRADTSLRPSRSRRQSELVPGRAAGTRGRSRGIAHSRIAGASRACICLSGVGLMKCASVGLFLT